MTFEVPMQNHLTLIMGQVGAGKSGLISALIGELAPKSGSLKVNGSVAYASQVPWIRHATVRENIVFDKKYDPMRYAAVVNACELLADFKTFTKSDETEIGEKGINLSGNY